MAENLALIAGATGAAASRLVALLAQRPDWSVVGLCRTPPSEPPAGVRYIAADLTDAASCARAVAEAGSVTHVVYACRAAHGENGVEDVAANAAMLRHLIVAADRPALRHVHLLEGTKWYGMHLGPYETPSREDAPRHMPPNFYYDQQDLLEASSAGKAWRWSASRPGLIIDVAPGRARNMISTIGAYAAICRALDLPFDFPGRRGAYDALLEVTDASLLARGIAWMLTAENAANQAFNLTNGDVFRWSRLWPRIGRLFGLREGRIRPLPLGSWMADKAPLWDRIVAHHDLRPMRLDQLALWSFAEFALGFEYDVFSSMTKLRQAGFTEAVDTEAVFLGHLEAYREARLLP